jgi:hypothetical protein
MENEIESLEAHLSQDGHIFTPLEKPGT